MFNATHCKSCGKKEAKNGEGCNNSKCKEYYKLKGVKKHRTTSQKKRDTMHTMHILWKSRTDNR